MMIKQTTLFCTLALVAGLAACSTPQPKQQEPEPVEEAAEETEPTADEQVIQPPKPGASWGYGEEAGPEEWGELSPEFEMCAIGKNQSPVDIADPLQAQNLPDPEFNYAQGPSELVHKGYSLQANYPSGNQMTVEGKSFELVQFHFHVPAEHTIQGKEYPLEGHFVHSTADGDLAVATVMFEEGEANPELEELLQNVPTEKGEEVSLEGTQFDALEMMPAKLSHYRYNGSLTTPPCSEGVRFLIFDTPVSASAEQIQKIYDAVGHENARPIQPINARVIVR